MAELAPILSLKNISLSFQPGKAVVNQLCLDLPKGQTVAIVGESGSGKSLTALSILGLLPDGSQRSGQILFQGEDLASFSEQQLQNIRGNRIAMIFQEPLTALNPLHRVGEQIAEMFYLHQGLSYSEATPKVIDLLIKVGIDEPERRMMAYPHELSGGQRQRVMIAMALANEPDILIADEPTTALDVSIQAQILDLLMDLQRQMGLSILFITHDLAIVRKIAHQVCVMSQGELVETGSCQALFSTPKHAYTRALLDAEPDGAPQPIADQAEILLDIKDFSVNYSLGKPHLLAAEQFFPAVQQAALSLHIGETLGIVGESGSGKTSLGLALLRLVQANGQALFQGKDIFSFRDKGKDKQLKAFRRQAQIVFQDPFGSLSPRMSVAEIIQEGVCLHMPELTQDQVDKIVCQVLQDVHIDPAMRYRYPHEFSGGQRQRISIARALALSPKLIILDEPTSALDRLVQKELCQLLRELQARYQMSYVFISHDLQVVRAMNHHICVMQGGKIVEQGNVTDIFDTPCHDYTRQLLAHINLG